MSDFFHKLISGDAILPPDPVQASLYRRFENPTKVEWYLRDKCYEAVFYVNTREYLARFSQDGELLDHKVNLTLDSLPARILRSAGSRGEIMNAVAIHSGKDLRYEIIYRDEDLKRYLMLLDSNAAILSEKLL